MYFFNLCLSINVYVHVFGCFSCLLHILDGIMMPK